VVVQQLSTGEHMATQDNNEHDNTPSVSADMSSVTSSSVDWTAEEWANIEADTLPMDVFADRIFEQLETAPPLLTQNDIDKITDRSRKNRTHRTALFLLTMSWKELHQKTQNDRDFAMAAAGVCYAAKEEAVSFFDGLFDVIKHADIRVSLA
jgi:hypothetical protein